MQNSPVTFDGDPLHFFKMLTTRSHSLLMYLVALALAALFALPAYSQDFPYESCHLEESAAKTVAASLTYRVYTPKGDATEWLAIVATPPELPGQRKISATLFADSSPRIGLPSNELSPKARPILMVRVPATTATLQKTLSVQSDYIVTLAPHKLVPGAASTEVAALSDAEEKRYLAPSTTIDFDSEPFKHWMDDHNLHRQQSESDIKFAWRVFSFIRHSYAYKFRANQDRHASSLCKTGSTDCGGLSFLFTAVIRANNIPARCLIGKLARSDTDKDKSAACTASCHVKSEFFAKDIGWIPVEMSGAVSHKDADPLLFFGRDKGDLITFHVDPDLILDSIWFEQKQVTFLQTPILWSIGSGTWDEAVRDCVWQVEELTDDVAHPWKNSLD
jgi:hypothetical protein